jgi:membrane protease YdiL (CAAX protease family)
VNARNGLRLPALDGARARRSQAAALVVVLYTAAIVGAEGVAVVGGVAAGIVCDAVLLGLLWTHYVLASRGGARSLVPAQPLPRALPALALLPLLRILSVTMPVNVLPQISWYALIGVPLLLAVVLTARVLDLPASSLGLRVPGQGGWPGQALIALSGLPLAVIAFSLMQPEPLIARTEVRVGPVLVDALILLLFVGFAEELLFRGLLQQVAVDVFGRAGLLWSSALFAFMHLGSLSPSYVLFMLLVGLFFAWCVERTGALWGVAVAHGVLISLVLLI